MNKSSTIIVTKYPSKCTCNEKISNMCYESGRCPAYSNWTRDVCSEMYDCARRIFVEVLIRVDEISHIYSKPMMDGSFIIFKKKLEDGSYIIRTIESIREIRDLIETNPNKLE